METQNTRIELFAKYFTDTYIPKIKEEKLWGYVDQLERYKKQLRSIPALAYNKTARKIIRNIQRFCKRIPVSLRAK